MNTTSTTYRISDALGKEIERRVAGLKTQYSDDSIKISEMKVTRGIMIYASTKRSLHYKIFDIYLDLFRVALNHYGIVYGTDLMKPIHELPDLANKFSLDNKDMFLSDAEALELYSKITDVSDRISMELSSIYLDLLTKGFDDDGWTREADELSIKLSDLANIFDVIPTSFDGGGLPKYVKTDSQE